ncbi:MAG: hypothetical protein ACK4FJ_07745 [Ferrovibrio sp.]|uniref:hypothetical protein n=1 Tax=Ferrovibrio sp. TaxID=1917215 RepID=UPI00391C6B88
MARKKPEFLPPQQDLRRKAVNFSKGFRLKLEPAELRRLETVVEKARDALSLDVSDKLKQLRAALEDVALGQQTDRGMRAIRMLSLEIKGAGGMFNYPLLTEFAKSLNDFVKGIEQPTPLQLDIIAAQIDALYVVLGQRIEGQGGKLEQELLAVLRQAIERHKTT